MELHNNNNDKISLIDWHLHSYYSDGIYNPIELLRIGLSADIHTSLTDHDTVRGLKEAVDYSKPNNIKFTAGIELSTTIPGLRSVHLLGYFNSVKESELEELEERLKPTQEERTKRTAERLKRAHDASSLLNIQIEDLKERNPHSAYIGESHVCDTLWRKGEEYTSYEEARSAIKRMKFWEEVPEYYTHSPRDGIRLIKKYGGVVSLAHISRFNMNEDEEKSLIRELKDKGLDALEVISSRFKNEQIVRYLRYVNEFGLKITVGSDYHSQGNTPNFRIGFNLDYTITDAMLQDIGISREGLNNLLLLK